MSGASTPATEALRRSGVYFQLRSYSHDPASASFGLEAAAALGVDPDRVFKTLIIDCDGRLAVAIVPVHRALSLKAAASALGEKKAVMASVADAERSTGYVRGGISPLGQRRRLATVVDTSAGDHATVLVSGGRRGLDVELAPSDLIDLTGAVVAAIADPT